MCAHYVPSFVLEHMPTQVMRCLCAGTHAHTLLHIYGQAALPPPPHGLVGGAGGGAGVCGEWSGRLGGVLLWAARGHRQGRRTRTHTHARTHKHPHTHTHTHTHTRTPAYTSLDRARTRQISMFASQNRSVCCESLWLTALCYSILVNSPCSSFQSRAR